MRLILILVLGLLLTLSATASDLSIVILKSERRLEVFRGEKKIHSFRVGLGNTPVGDKLQSGDGKTPEGSFYVCVKNPKSRFYLSLGISYPDAADASRGLRDGLITKAEHERIIAAQQKRTTPPWNTALGGEVFIHGNGSSSDWTLGCVALEDVEMRVLFDMIEVGTAVIIKP